MKIRRILCIAAILCLLCPLAAADGSSSVYGSPVNIMLDSAQPYRWDAQVRYNGDTMTWHIDKGLDGNRATLMEHACWNDESLDDIPELSFYFSGATIQDVWYRNALDSNDPTYTDYARLYRIEIVVWVGDNPEPYGPYIFRKLPDTCDPSVVNGDWINGYYRLGLPKQFTNVTQVDLYIKGWYPGEGARKTKYWMQFSDIAFLPDTLANLYGPYMDDQYYGSRNGNRYNNNGNNYNGNNYYNYQTATPTLIPMPTVTPVPETTAAPSTGIDIMVKDRISVRTGPGTKYAEMPLVQAADLDSIKWVKAISSFFERETGIWWVQIELTYRGEQRRVYTEASHLLMSPDQVQVEEIPARDVILTYSAYPYWGPGYTYSMYGDKLPAGTEGKIRMTEGAYAQFEYFDGTQYRRVWIPETATEESNG